MRASSSWPEARSWWGERWSDIGEVDERPLLTGLFSTTGFACKVDPANQAQGLQIKSDLFLSETFFISRIDND